MTSFVQLNYLLRKRPNCKKHFLVSSLGNGWIHALYYVGPSDKKLLYLSRLTKGIEPSIIGPYTVNHLTQKEDEIKIYLKKH